MEDATFLAEYLASKALVNVRLDDKQKDKIIPALNGSVAVFRDEASMQKAAELMGRKGPGDVDIDGTFTFEYPKKGGGTVRLFGVHYDNVKRDEHNKSLAPTPAETLEKSVPTVSAITKDAGGQEVKDAVEKFLRARQTQKGQ
jgi:hypothetical protein